MKVHTFLLWRYFLLCRYVLLYAPDSLAATNHQHLSFPRSLNLPTRPSADTGSDTSSSRSTPPMVLSPGHDKPSHDPPELVADGAAAGHRVLTGK